MKLKKNYLISVYVPGNKVPTQLVDIPDAMKKIPMRKSSATHELYFAVQLEPVSYKTFYIRRFHLRRPWTSSGDRSKSDDDVERSSEVRKRRSLYNDQHHQRRLTSDNGQQHKLRFLYNDQQHQRRLSSTLTSNNGRHRKRRSLYNYQPKNRIYPIVDLNSTRNRRGNGVKYFKVGLKYFPRRYETEKSEVDVEDQLDDDKFNFKNQVCA